MTVFVALINNHNSALYTWHEFSSKKYLSYLSRSKCKSHVFFFGTKFMPSVECTIVIIDQYCKNSHYYATMQVCKRIWWFLVDIVLTLMWLRSKCNSDNQCEVNMTHQFLQFKAYCVGRSKCRALPLYTVKLIKTRAILILPRMWLGQYEYCLAALAPWALPYKLCPELCQCMYKLIRWVFSMFLAVLTSDSIASMAKQLTVRVLAYSSYIHYCC